MKHFLLKTVLLLCALVVGSSAWADEVTDELTWNGLGLTGSNQNYSAFSNKSFNSDAVYAGNASSGQGKYIQLRSSNSNSGIITTTSGGKIKSIIITWSGDNSTSGRYIDVYGKNSAYSSAGDLYSNNSSTQGSSLGGLSVVTNTEDATTTLNVDGEYEYIGIRSRSGAIYCKKIEVVWEVPSSKTVSAISVKTAPTKTEYKVGETFSASGLELTATYDDASTETISSGYTMKIGDTALANDDVLNEAGTKTITITYGDQTTTQDITIGTLSSLTYNSTGEGAFANTIYTEKDHFDPTGLVVTAHYTNGISETVTDYTLNPSTTDELATTNTAVTVSYTWAETEQTVKIPITVNAGTKYTVSFDAGNGTYTGGDITETAYQGGITLPTATTSVAGWVFAGWKETSAATNTTTRPTLFAAGSTYKPTANCTLYAVYMLEDAVNKYRAATANGDIVDGLQVVISAVGTSYQKTMGNNNGTIVDIDNFTPDVNGEITCANSQALWTLSISNGNVIISNNGKSLKRSSTTLSLDNSGTNWTISKASYGTNRFLIKDASYNYYIERGSSSWVAYNASSVTNNNTTSYIGLTIYVPVSTAYNSNPSAIITPTVEFGKSGTTLYLDAADKTYTNTASVEGVSKAITYSSSDNTIAEVDANGVVTAKKIGTATITASVEKELGVSNAAQDTYDVTVKSTTTISGIKALTSTSTSVSFTADLTDAVVTYVNGSHAYIQDASGAVYASCGTSLTAGQKINGAVSGSVKAAYQIDEITSLDVTEATVTNDGDIPAAEVKTLAQIKAGDYDGKLVTVNAVSISKSNTTTTLTDGSKIDDTEVSFTMYSPNSAASVNDQEKGNFTGFVSIYNGSTYRLNLYEQSQFVKTHNAPTAQDLTFESNAIELDEDTEAFANFTGQTVEGAEGTVIYSIDIDEETPVVTSINAETGAVVLSGAYGTATIKATAAATEKTVAGVTTPYTETTKSYTVQVYPRYTATFNVNGDVSEVRQATHGAEIEVPSPAAIGDYVFKGWSTTTVAATDVAPSTTEVTNAPTADATYYAVFAKETITQVPGEVTSVLTLNNGTVSSPYVNNGVTWTHSGLDFVTSGNGDMPNGSTVSIQLPSSATSIKSINAPAASGWSTKNISIALRDVDSDVKITTFNNGISYSFTTSNNSSKNYSLTATNADSRKAYMNTITVVYNGLVDAVSYSGYTTEIITGVENRTMEAGKIGTICLPYAVKAEAVSNAKVYKVAGKVMSGDDLHHIVFEELEGDMVAGTPYIFKTTAANPSFVYVEESEATEPVTENTNGLVGSFVKASIENGVDNYIFSNNQLYLVNTDNVKVGANRAYIHLEDVPVYNPNNPNSSVKGINIFAEGVDETTAIIAPRTTMLDGDYYNLQGQRVENPTHGIYIVNGKKVFIK